MSKSLGRPSRDKGLCAKSPAVFRNLRRNIVSTSEPFVRSCSHDNDNQGAVKYLQIILYTTSSHVGNGHVLGGSACLTVRPLFSPGLEAPSTPLILIQNPDSGRRSALIANAYGLP